MITGFVLGLTIALLFGWVLIPLFLPRGRLRAFEGARAENLIESRNAIYRSMIDLDFDRSLGKVSEDDYTVLKSQHEADAAEVLQQIDALNGGRDLHPIDPLEEEIAAARRRRA